MSQLTRLENATLNARLLNSFRMMRLPEAAPSRSAEERAALVG